MGDQAASRRADKDALFEQFARVGKALASPKRLELLDLLAQGERTVDSLARAASVGVTTCSAHLQALRQARLVATRKEGTRVYYRLAGPDIAALYAALQHVAATHIGDVNAAARDYLGPDDTEHLDRDELLRRVRAGQVVVIDVRPAEEYTAGHIPGAVSIPLAELTDQLGALPADRQIVAYCRGAYCVMAHDAVRELTSRGRDAARLVDGMLEWRLADLPVQTQDVA
jgi:rhodanese-related sulfurtransferase/DNA-binding HxlR family transcriptional regulator